MQLVVALVALRKKGFPSFSSLSRILLQVVYFAVLGGLYAVADYVNRSVFETTWGSMGVGQLILQRFQERGRGEPVRRHLARARLLCFTDSLRTMLVMREVAVSKMRSDDFRASVAVVRCRAVSSDLSAAGAWPVATAG